MWHDPETNLIVYDVQDPKILQYVLEAKPIDGRYIAMPASFQNLQIMRCLGHPVIRPLENKYDWPRARIIKDPFHAQVETANFLTVHPRACVLSDMGTGKTLSALWAADALMADSPGLRAIVVAPLSTLQTVWASAVFQHFLGRRTAVIVHGSEDKRLEALAQPHDFYLVNHDGIKVGAKLDNRRRLELSGFAAALVSRPDIRLTIIDEVGAFRDYRSLRSKVARLLFGPRDYLWLMTGTPTPNGPLDAYGIGKLLDNAGNEFFTHYKSRVMLQVNKWKWVPKAGAHEEALRMMAPYIRFSIDDCMDLPELTYQDRSVELSSEQVKLLREIKRDLILQLGKGEITVANEAALRIKMLQIASGVVYDKDHKEHKVDCRPRLRALREIIGDESAKTIVFAPFTSVVNMINSALKDFTRAVILGATPVKERTQIINAFQQERDPRVLIAHPETIAHGQTLTAAATTVWFGPVDKTDSYIQANKRMHRPGQNRPCTVVNLAGSSLEGEVFRRLAANESMQGLMLKMVEMGI